MAAVEIFADQPSTVVSAGGTTTGSTSFTVASPGVFPQASSSATPPTQFHIADANPALQSEIMTVTNVSGSTWTVTRGAEGTTAVAHNANWTAVQVVTSGWLGTVTGQNFGYPYQFFVQAFGAKGDGKVLTDATMSNGSAVLTSASNPFTAADVNKAIVVTRAGSGANTYTPLITTIASYQSAGQVTLAATASTAVSGAGAVYGTDDTTAIQNTVNAAVTYAQGQVTQFAEVIFSPAYYMVAGSPVTGGGTQGNAQITLPVVSASSGYKVNLKLTGTADVTAAPEHWLQVTQNAPGSVLVCANGSGSYSATYGPSCMIGGPVNGYGGGGGTYSNMQLTVEGLTCLLPYTTTIGGLNLYGVGQAWIKSFSVMPMAVVPAAGSAWPQLVGGGPANNQYTAGLILPAVGNNARNDIGYYTCYGANIALAAADHLNWAAMRTLFCGVGWLPICPSGNEAHAGNAGNWCCEETQNPVLCLEGSVTWAGYKLAGYVGMQIAALTLETFVSGYIVTGDSSGYLTGVIWFENLQDSAGPTNQPYYAVMADHLSVSLKSLEAVPGPVASPHAVPSSGSPWNNYYYRDAWVTVALSGGNTFSAFTIDGTSQPNAVGAGTYQFLLPAGHSYTPTFSAGTLTHTVTLL